MEKEILVTIREILLTLRQQHADVHLEILEQMDLSDDAYNELVDAINASIKPPERFC